MHDETSLQLHRFAGARSGTHLLITAGVHGDEYLPMLAVRELIRRFETDTAIRDSLCGSVTLIPIVNRSAFRRGTRCGDDGMDLARICPGRENGTTSERVAHALSNQIIASNFYIDLHTGGTELSVHPLAGYVLHKEQSILDQQRELARSFQFPMIWGTSPNLPGRSLSVARDAGVPAIYVEYLGAHQELTEISRANVNATPWEHPLVHGCLNVMRYLDILDQPAQDDITQTVIEDWRVDSGHMQICHPAPVSGFLTIKVTLGQQIHVGDLIAEIQSDTDDQVHPVFAEQEGTMVVLREYPRINRGDTVAVIAESYGKP